MWPASAIHHPLRDVDTSASYITALINISHFMHGPAMNAYPHRKRGMRLRRLADFQSAFDRCLG